MSRYFRTSPAIYSAVRAGLDAAFGHPYERIAEDGTTVRTETCLPPVEQQQQDGEGRVVVSLIPIDYERPEVAPMLADLIGAGQVEEIAAEAYFAALAVDH